MRRTAGSSISSTAISRRSAVPCSPGPGGGPPEFQTTMSMPPNASTVISTAAPGRGPGHVATYRERADSVGLLLELVAPAPEHGDVRALVGERLGGCEAEPG